MCPGSTEGATASAGITPKDPRHRGPTGAARSLPSRSGMKGVDGCGTVSKMSIVAVAGVLLIAGACQERSLGTNDAGASAGSGGSGGGDTGGRGGATSDSGASGGESGRCSGGPTYCGQGPGNHSCGITSPAPPGGVPPEATTCSATDGGVARDECACQGNVCPAGQLCISVAYPPPFGGGGPGYVANSCFAVCTAATDCGAGNACLANYYGIFQCRALQCESDAGCAGDACGHCVPVLNPIHGGDQVLSAVHTCIYEGGCGAGTCAGCSAAPDLQYGTGFHFCSGS